MAETPGETKNSDEAPTYSGPVTVGEHFLIDLNSPLPELDSPSATAYAAEDRRDLGRKLFALACTPGLPPRVEAMNTLRKSEISGLLQLTEWDIVDWPPQGRRCLVVLFERPLGGRLLNALAAGNVPIDKQELPSRIIESVLGALRDLANRNITHRAIRPSNLFFADEEKKTVVLGECVTSPPGFDQPLACEPIERAMATAGGRGAGDIADDFYALGATLMLLLVGSKHIDPLGDTEIFYAKIERGSYAALCGEARIPMFLLEPLRGLLVDDPAERWMFSEMDSWSDGKRQTPIQRKATPKSETPFAFNDRDHNNARTLAHAFSQEVGAAATAIRDGHLGSWLRHNLHDPDLADQVEVALEVAKANQGGFQGSDEYLVAKIGIMLDPMAPIRYKDFAFMPECYGSALAVEFLRSGDIQVAADAVTREIPGIWLATLPRSDPRKSPLDRTFGQSRRFIQENDLGYGIVRCLYELNPDLPCQSSLIADDYAIDTESLMAALDRASNRVDAKTKPMDRHICAFIAARFDQDITPHLKALAAPKEETSLIGMLSLLAFLQWRLKIDALFGLSSWVGGLLGPAINTYKSRTTRREMESEIPRLVRLGSLPDLFDLIDNAERRQKDAEGYLAAQEEYAQAEEEIGKIERGEIGKSGTPEQMGQQSAAMISIILSMIVVTIFFLVEAL